MGDSGLTGCLVHSQINTAIPQSDHSFLEFAAHSQYTTLNLCIGWTIMLNKAVW